MGNKFDYYYGNEAEQFRFYQIPKELLDNPEFSSLTLDAKILYAVLRDRMQLSKSNSWIDAENRIFIIFPVEAIAGKLGIGNEKAVKLLKDLEHFGLVEKKRRGQGMSSLLYIKNFAGNRHPSEERNPPSDESDAKESPGADTQCCCKAGDRESDNASEIGKPEFLNTENPISENRKTRIPEIGKTDSNDLKKNNPDRNNRSFNHISSMTEPTDRLIERHPSVVLGLHEHLSPEEHMQLDRILEKNNGIPWILVSKPDCMKKMMMHIGCWKEIFQDERSTDNVTVHRVIIECLTEMALEPSPWSCKGSMITYRHVIERINCTLQEANGTLLYAMIDRVVCKYLEASIENYIQNPKQYLKAIIWEELNATRLESDSYYRKRVRDDSI